MQPTVMTLQKELGYIFLHPQIRYLCSNILETGYIRSFWPYFGQVWLVMYLYNRLVLCSADFGRRELGYMFLESQIWYLCINDLETGHIRSFWPHFWWARLVIYLYSRYTPWRNHFGRKKIWQYVSKALKKYLCLNDLENDQIRSFWPHFQVEHFVHGMDMLRRVYGTLLYGSLCWGIFSELLELGHAVILFKSASNPRFQNFVTAKRAEVKA